MQSPTPKPSEHYEGERILSNQDYELYIAARELYERVQVDDPDDQETLFKLKKRMDRAKKEYELQVLAEDDRRTIKEVRVAIPVDLLTPLINIACMDKTWVRETTVDGTYFAEYWEQDTPIDVVMDRLNQLIPVEKVSETQIKRYDLDMNIVGYLLGNIWYNSTKLAMALCMTEFNKDWGVLYNPSPYMHVSNPYLHWKETIPHPDSGSDSSSNSGSDSGSDEDDTSSTGSYWERIPKSYLTHMIDDINKLVVYIYGTTMNSGCTLAGNIAEIRAFLQEYKFVRNEDNAFFVDEALQVKCRIAMGDVLTAVEVTILENDAMFSGAA
jgi:hypothetical protein